MGVSKYIEEISSKIEDRIQKNLESIAAAPYPKDELDKLKASNSESPISKSYGEEGRISGIPSEAIQQAASQDPDLFKRLEEGSRSLRKAKQNDRLRAVDPNTLLSSRYSAFLDGLANSEALGSKLSVAEVLQSGEDEFESIYDLLISDARERGSLIDQVDIDVSAATAIAAFSELNAKGATAPVSSGSPINETTREVAPIAESQSVVNLPRPTAGSEESVERVSSTVVGAKVEIPAEVSPSESPISINIENEQVKPVTLPGSETRTENVNPGGTSSPEITTSTGINNSTVSNETSSQTTASSSTTSITESPSFIENYSLPLSSEKESNTDRSFEKYSSTVTQAINSTEKTGFQKEKEGSTSVSNDSKSTINSSEKSQSFLSSISNANESDLRYFESLTGINLSSFMGEKTSASESKTATESREREKLGTIEKITSSQEQMGVTKDSPSFPEKIMPASTPSTFAKEIQKAAATMPSPETQSVKVESIPSTQTTVPQSSAGEMATQVSQNQSTQLIGFDELTRRMSRIEYLLSNPLEVKLVD
jgi:hypothetical protein